MMTRREWAATAAGTALARGEQADGRIDRRALVRRHNPVLTEWNALAPLSIGNGEFAFTCDLTGLQTFPELHEGGTPLCTQSQWGWHTSPNTRGLRVEDLKLTEFETHGRKVGYSTGGQGQLELFSWLRQNPHRLHLGRIGLSMTAKDGQTVKREALRPVKQELDLWTGTIRSEFEVERERVEVRVACHPQIDALAVSVRGGLLGKGRLAVALEFPYASPEMGAADWTKPEAHRSAASAKGPRGVEIGRLLDNDRYTVNVWWDTAAEWKQEGPHRFVLRPLRANELEAVVHFSVTQELPARPPAKEVFAAAEKQWERFWSSGAAVDLSASAAGDARELERRIVLSQYLTAIQCAGTLPPQETGLTCNSWYGKFHLEMHWWHAAHFALWGRLPLLERSLGWYERTLPAAREIARLQGYRGARWPKMVGPEGRDSPSPIGPLLIWQQPHILSFAELCYQIRKDRATLQRFWPLIEATAEFMASFAHWEEAGKRFVLGPPLIPAQENHPPRETWNPAFELAYWSWGLEIAQQWRERLGQARNAEWERVRRDLSDLPLSGGVYLAHENCPQTYAERNRDHPSMLMAMGFLPGAMADRETMRRTLKKVFATWRWEDTWGWDYPMVAMTAARVGEPELAVQALMMETPKNVWLPNGHNYQRENLPLYLPGNGGLLAAIAMMAGGWQGGPGAAAPGFPKAGWAVRQEGLLPLL